MSPEPLWRVLKEVGYRLLIRQRQIQDGEISVQHKDDGSPVSIADLESHRSLVSFLGRWTPNIPVLSEENNEEEAARFQGGAPERFWVMDPLDGTRGFIRNDPEFCIALALIEVGEPVFSVLYAPALELKYYSGIGIGSFMEREGEHARSLEIRANTELQDSEPLTFLKSKHHHSPKIQRLMETLKAGQILELGSTLKFGAFAEERGHVYGRGSPVAIWDLAPGEAIVRYALNRDGKESCLYTADSSPSRGYVSHQTMYPPFVMISPRVKSLEAIKAHFMSSVRPR